jgi:hypothetical protein
MLWGLRDEIATISLPLRRIVCMLTQRAGSAITQPEPLGMYPRVFFGHIIAMEYWNASPFAFSVVTTSTLTNGV